MASPTPDNTANAAMKLGSADDTLDGSGNGTVIAHLKKLISLFGGGIDTNPSAVAPISSGAAGSGLVLSAAPCKLFGLDVNALTVSGWVMIFDAVAVPADGAVVPLKAFPISGGQALALEWNPVALKMLVGCSVCFSTTGPFNKTANTNATFSGEVA